MTFKNISLRQDQNRLLIEYMTKEKEKEIRRVKKHFSDDVYDLDDDQIWSKLLIGNFKPKDYRRLNRIHVTLAILTDGGF